MARGRGASRRLPGEAASSDASRFFTTRRRRAARPILISVMHADRIGFLGLSSAYDNFGHDYGIAR